MLVLLGKAVRELPPLLAIIGVCFLWRYPWLLLLFGLGLSLWDVLLFKNKKAAVKVWLFGAVLGPVMEMLTIWCGAWQYSKTDFFNIPLWLAPMWGLAALFFARRTMSRRME